jgi:methyl-accepting chemotaxis protein
VSAMTASIHHLNKRAERMTTMSLSLQDLAGLTERESKNVAGLAGDTAKRTDEVSASSQQISLTTGEIYRELGVQNTEVTHIVGEIGRARQQLNDLQASVVEIDTIVGAVHHITDKTRILSINAAIEAVRAREHGHGFAVIANEVKELSQNTAHATRDVLDKIEAIKVTCRTFIDSFDTLEQGAEQLRQVTATIGQAINRQRELTGAIVELTTATGEDTKDVSTRIAEVNNAAAGVLELSADARQDAEEIALQLSDLLFGSVHDLETMSLREGVNSDTQIAPPQPNLTFQDPGRCRPAHLVEDNLCWVSQL